MVDTSIVRDKVENVHEGELTRAIETQTAKIPSIAFLNLAVGSMALSAVTALIFGKRQLGTFFGLWVPSLMLIGVYNKLVKMEAHIDRQHLH